MVNKEIILKKLKSVLDPELGVSIVDLGLVYNVKIKNGQVKVLMTLTTMGCPLFSVISQEIEQELKKISGVKNVAVELTFEPPWTPEKMSKETKAKVGFLS